MSTKNTMTMTKSSPLGGNERGASYFHSNETLECCDVSVSQQGNITVDPKKYNADAVARLGVPAKAVRGRVRVEDGLIKFDPYGEASRKPTFSHQVVVGSTTLQCTEDKVKVSFMVPRHLRKELMVMYIQSEIDEVKRRLALDVYDMLAKASNDNANDTGHQDGKVGVNVNVNVNVEEKGGQS